MCYLCPSGYSDFLCKCLRSALHFLAHGVFKFTRVIKCMTYIPTSFSCFLYFQIHGYAAGGARLVSAEAVGYVRSETSNTQYGSKNLNLATSIDVASVFLLRSFVYHGCSGYGKHCCVSSAESNLIFLRLLYIMRQVVRTGIEA